MSLQALAITLITEAVSRYLEVRLYLTAGLYMHASTHTAVWVLPTHLALKNLFSLNRNWFIWEGISNHHPQHEVWVVS